MPAKGKVEIYLEYCKGCGLCAAVCPLKHLAISDELGPLGVNPVRTVGEARCTLCRNCTTVCPDGAIRLIRLDKDE